MASYDIFGNPIKKSNNPFGMNLGTQKKEQERDSRRAFSSSQRKEIWAQQNGKCANCHTELDIRTAEYDHVKPWADKGKTIVANGAALCPHCHKLKNHSENLKKADKKRVTKKQEDSPSGTGNGIFGKPPKRGSNPWGF